MIKKDIKTREDIHLLVSSFYDKVRKDTILGPFFNEAISDWDKHINHLTDFWNQVYFFAPDFLETHSKSTLK